MDTTSTLMVPDHKKNKQMIFILLAIIVALSVAYVVMIKLDLTKPDPLSIESRMKALGELSAISTAPTPTPLEQRAQLDDLSSISESKTSEVNQLQQLESLSSPQE